MYFYGKNSGSLSQYVLLFVLYNIAIERIFIFSTGNTKPFAGILLAMEKRSNQIRMICVIASPVKVDHVDYIIVVGGNMWTVIYIATNNVQAEAMKNLLCTEGILANTRATGVASVTGEGLYEILVLESEADEANEILCQHAITKKGARS